ncbi:hypothetical protein ASPZODRAFT_135693 [Penicilliopsis zonata CBS 506.65]|uniref:Cell cycle control protein n=1 Tax=Penicilliopsis zonata CBS 506.65 TaxID=1073090 RepID=A0A1L9SAJ2_9EURO|nr:hypothetical protein ASPZODRAFT_135693 [Penicilliopsis zonata CBS 506.65]OJJ44202.1 hypothetical protein ASPZODRAFT_135693 [Penicilliopsis zonata CBS 506.65]
MSNSEVNYEGSLDGQEHGRDDGDKKPQSRRPANTAFRQQRLKAWQPILTPKSVLPLFFIVGIIFAPIGGLLLWASSEVQEIVIDYTDCSDKAPLYPTAPATFSNVHSYFKSSKQTSAATWQRRLVNVTFDDSLEIPTNRCSIFFELPDSIGPPVYLYYRLTNFYQNHRRYVQSLDLEQLKGEALDNSSISGSSCDPLRLDPVTGKAYYPCGLIANSLFNDSIHSPELVNNGTYVMTNKGIAWESDKDLIKKTQYKPDQVVPPPNWHKRYPNGYTEENLPNLHENEEFMVWMRTAGLPNFSKLARRNDTTAMQAGNYQLDIDDYFPVTEYGGTKQILISTRTVMGGRNPFMGIAYVVVGGLCIVLGALFTVAYLIKPRKLGDHTYLTWNNDHQSTAVATGRDDRFGGHAS